MSQLSRLSKKLLPVVVSVFALIWVILSVEHPERLAEAVTWRVACILFPAFVLYGAFTLLLESASILRLVQPAS